MTRDQWTDDDSSAALALDPYDRTSSFSPSSTSSTIHNTTTNGGDRRQGMSGKRGATSAWSAPVFSPGGRLWGAGGVGRSSRDESE